MSLLRFDPSGSINAILESLEAKSTALAISLTIAAYRNGRDRSGNSTTAVIFPKKAAAGRPVFLAAGGTVGRYTKPTVSNSELGRIFKVANGMHDEIDAVAVLGIGGSYMGARAMMDACCDPYHNELDSRQSRQQATDVLRRATMSTTTPAAALLHRLAQGGYGDSSVPKKGLPSS